MKLVHALFLALSFAAAGALAQTAAPKAAKPAAKPAAAASADSPALWRIATPKGQVHLFGSMHLMPPDVRWRTPAVARALDQARVVVFETDIGESRDQEVVRPLLARYGLLRDDTLEKHLPPQVYAELVKTAEAFKLPMAQLQNARPWLAAVLLGVQFIIEQGFDPAKGVDQLIYAWANEKKKIIGALESMEEQIQVFSQIPREQEIELLSVTLRQIRETPGLLKELLAAYRKGDVAGLERVLNLGLDELPALRKRLLRDRHEVWLPQIEKLMERGGNVFVVVGAAHLAGPDSLITMLRAKGIKVEGP